MNRSNILQLTDIQIFKYKETDRYFAAVAYGCSDSPDYILNLDLNCQVSREVVQYVRTYWTTSEAKDFCTDSAIRLLAPVDYGAARGNQRLSTVFAHFHVAADDYFINENDDPDDYASDVAEQLTGTFRFANCPPGDGESMCIEMNGSSQTYYAHIGYIAKSFESDHNWFGSAIEYAHSLNSYFPTNSISREHEIMSTVTQKGAQIATGLIQTNKEGMAVVAQLTAGGTALQIAVNRIEQFIPADKREQFKVYANTPLGKLAVANLLSVAQGQFLGGNNKAKYIADGAVISAMNEVAQALPIQQIVVDLFSGVEVNLPE